MVIQSMGAFVAMESDDTLLLGIEISPIVLATTARQDRSTIVDDHRRRSALIHHEEDDLTVSEYNYQDQIEATFKDSFLFLSPSNSSIVAE